DHVLMVFAAREGVERPFPAEGIPAMDLEGLDPDASRALFADRLGGANPEVADRLIVDTRGNPLALLELPTELSSAQLQGTAPLPARLQLTTHVEQVFLDRSRRLDAPAQTVLLLVAADDTGELAVVSDAAVRLDAGDGAVETALASGLLSTDG